MSLVVVLLGPPGSGKSAVGAVLRQQGLRWRDTDAAILERWGSRERFIANKAIGLQRFHEEILDLIASEDSPVVFETTGLSDGAFLDELERTHDVFVVRLDVSVSTALARTAEREQGRHLTDDAEAHGAIWQAFALLVTPHRHADLVIDTEKMSTEDAAGLVFAQITDRRPEVG